MTNVVKNYTFIWASRISGGGLGKSLHYYKTENSGIMH